MATDRAQHRWRRALFAPHRPAGATTRPARRLRPNAGPFAMLMSLAALTVVGVDLVRSPQTLTAPDAKPAGGTAAAPAAADGADAAGTSRCRDAAGDAAPEVPGSLDLVAVTVRRDAKGLHVRFELSDPPGTEGVPGAWWEVMLADGDTVLYALSVSSSDSGWEASLVDFTGSGGDRTTTLKAPATKAIDVTVPPAGLRKLPAAFTWWATTLSDDLAASDIAFADTCPDAAGALPLDEEGSGLPAEGDRMAFPA